MRRIFMMIPLLAAVAGAQTMTEVGASAAGSVIGSAAGKKVSEGVSSIFGKLDATTHKAAKQAEDNSKSAPLLDVGPGAPRSSGVGESVPPPPPVVRTHRASVAKPELEPLPEIVPPPPPPALPPPAVTAADLKNVTKGMKREDVLKLGAPASRLMMDDGDGHLVESFSYADKDVSIGRVRLTDGVVTSVEVR